MICKGSTWQYTCFSSSAYHEQNGWINYSQGRMNSNAREPQPQWRVGVILVEHCRGLLPKWGGVQRSHGTISEYKGTENRGADVGIMRYLAGELSIRSTAQRPSLGEAQWAVILDFGNVTWSGWGRDGGLKEQREQDPIGGRKQRGHQLV